MENNKNIMGLNFQIDPQYINNLAKQVVTSGICEALGDGALAQEIVKQFYNQRVDENGKFTESRYHSTQTLIEYMVKKILREETIEMVKEVMEEKRPQIREMIRKELSKKATIDSFYSAFMDGVIGNLSSRWCTSFNIEVEKKQEY